MLTKTFIEVAESFDTTHPGRSTAAIRKRTASDPERMQLLASTARLVNHAQEGSLRAAADLQEALSSNDLVRWATGALIDRQIEQGYAAIEKQWPKLFQRTTVRSFKPKPIGQTSLPGQSFYDIPELTEYPMARGGGLSEYFLQVGKTGIRYGWSFEARINDDLDQLMAVPNSFPDMAANTEDEKALSQIINLQTGAPATAFFNATNKNLGQMVLNRANLLRVDRFLSTKRDPVQQGIIPTGGRLMLVVGPALDLVARSLLEAQQIETTLQDGSKVTRSNPLAGRFTVVVNEKQPGTSWMVIPAPGSAKKSPLWVAFLQGYETPDYRYLNNQGKALGGGDLGVDDGSFDEDAIYYRARHIVGATTADPTLTYASDNTGGSTEPAGMPTVADVSAMLS